MNYFGMVTTTASAQYTPHALRSCFAHTPFAPADRFFLIDNDGDYIPTPDQPAAVTLIRNPQPLGFAANMNQIMRLARADKADLLFLNNDIIFIPGWLEGLSYRGPAISAPMSNLQVQARCGAFELRQYMDLPEYAGHDAELLQIARQYLQSADGFSADFTIWFFAIRVPWSVYSVVGELDESFGRGGGEDIDYCLRCHLAGARVLTARKSFLLHFMGKSTWRSNESSETRRQREEQYQLAFLRKWGPRLFETTVTDNWTTIDNNEALKQARARGDYQTLVRALLP